MNVKEVGWNPGRGIALKRYLSAFWTEEPVSWNPSHVQFPVRWPLRFSGPFPSSPPPILVSTLATQPDRHLLSHIRLVEDWRSGFVWSPRRRPRKAQKGKLRQNLPLGPSRPVYWKVVRNLLMTTVRISSTSADFLSGKTFLQGESVMRRNNNSQLDIGWRWSLLSQEAL